MALSEGHGWLLTSLGIQQNFSNLGLKARYLAKDGKKSEAIKAAETALEMARASKDKPDTSALEKQLAEWKKN